MTFTMKMAFAVALAALIAPANASAAEGAFAKPDNVSVQRSGLGRVIADREGKTLYTYLLDTTRPGTSTCIDACAAAWPPLIAPADAKPVGAFSAIKRPDGALQWALNKKPLYTFVGDAKPGEANGEQVQQFWSAARYVPSAPDIVMPAVAKTQLVGEEFVLADARGMTLYESSADGEGRSMCEAACLIAWRPLEAAALSGPIGQWNTIERPDGSRQWAYKGHALYLFDGDGKPGDLDGVDGAWTAARP
ncbi:MAG: Secreted repeat of uncharacterized function [Phenylobacterium sp.]|nr:Secreted repeat of uncharacterized function [Phenylobacterium sp.]